jgi:F-type H+-transporting ATPase subunit alpha
MDAVTAATLDKGRKNTRLLVQPQYAPMAVEHQIAVLYCGTRGLMRDISIEQVADFERELLRELESTNVYEKLREGVIDDAVTARIEKAAERVTLQLKS